MLIDSTGLGFTIRGRDIFVHYPTRRSTGEEAVDGDTAVHGHNAVGWPIGPIPASYALAPPNAITAERVQLWEELRITASK